MSDKDDQDWLDLLAGQSVPDADPKIVREAQIFRGALLVHADRLENDSKIPYPHILANVLSRLETEAIRKPPKPPSWISTLSQTLKDVFASLAPPNKMAWAIPVLVISVITYIVYKNLIDTTVVPHKTFEIAHWGTTNTTYQTIYAKKTDEMVDDLRELSVRWEGEGDNVFAFSPTEQPSQAAKAFGAGLLIGREALLGKSEVALPTLLLPASEETWLKTRWADDFELGRWTVLLWTASRFHRDLPPTFWDEQRQIFSQFQLAFVVRAKTDSEAKKVLSQLENQIEPHLEKLPTEDNIKVYKELGFNLKKMMYFLAPKPESKF